MEKLEGLISELTDLFDKSINTFCSAATIRKDIEDVIQKNLLGNGNVAYIVDSFGKHLCLNCNRSIDKLRIFFDKDLLFAAIKAFEYSVKTREQFIQVNDIGLTKQEYSKINRLVKFGLAYRDKNILIRGTNNGVYGIPRKRISDFLKGQRTVAASFLQDPLLSEGDPGRREMSEQRITVNEVPSVHKLRESLGNKLTQYERNAEDIFE